MPGSAAEEHVVSYLLDSGWQILGRRVRIGHLEIDVLTRKDDVVAIVEIRGRRLDGWVSPLDSIRHAQKRVHLARAARLLWSRRFAQDPSVRVIRIDVAAVVYGPRGPSLEWVPGAVDPLGE